MDGPLEVLLLWHWEGTLAFHACIENLPKDKFNFLHPYFVAFPSERYGKAGPEARHLSEQL